MKRERTKLSETDRIDELNPIIVNRKILRAVGVDAALLFAFLINTYHMNNEYEANENDGGFHLSAKQIEKKTTLKRHKQTEAIKALQKSKLLVTKLKGAPAKRYFYIQ